MNGNHQFRRLGRVVLIALGCGFTAHNAGADVLLLSAITNAPSNPSNATTAVSGPIIVTPGRASVFDSTVQNTGAVSQATAPAATSEAVVPVPMIVTPPAPPFGGNIAGAPPPPPITNGILVPTPPLPATGNVTPPPVPPALNGGQPGLSSGSAALPSPGSPPALPRAPGSRF